MRIKIEYKNKDLEIVGYDYFEFDLYLQKMSQDVIGVLSDIEKCLDSHNADYNNDNAFRYIRHKLLDIAGALKRLPDNIVSDTNYSKATKKGILSIVKGD